MMLTIVIPVYNVRVYLRDCLASLPVENINVVLVNDGSTDGSEVICDEFAKTNPNTMVINKLNGGLSDARNEGIKHVTTDYVFYLDSDDKIDSVALLESLEFAKKNNLDWVQCGYAYDYGEYLFEYKFSYSTKILRKQEVLESLITDGIIKNFAWGKIYRTEIARRFLFPKGKFYEDVYWQYIVVANSSSFGFYNKTTTFYRQRKDGISGKFSIRNFDMLLGMEQRLIFFKEHYPVLAPIAAVSLWSLSQQFVSNAKFISKDDQQTFYEKAMSIKSNFRPLIKQGITKLPFISRLHNYALFWELSCITPFTSLMSRAYDRLKESDLLMKHLENV